MRTIEIEEDVYRDMLKAMEFLHQMVKRIYGMLMPDGNDVKWYTPYAAANILRISQRSLQTLKASGKIGYYQEEGGNCLFRKEDLLKLLDSSRKEVEYE